MNHDQQGSSQGKSKSTGGVPSLPSVLAPLAGYRYAKSIGDRETMLTEAQKFKAKLNDERIRRTEKHNQEVKGLQADLVQAQTNYEIATGTHKTQTDLLKRDVTESRSVAQRLRNKAIDLDIENQVLKGTPSEIEQFVGWWEQKNPGKDFFTDLTPEQRRWHFRLATKQALDDPKAMMAEEGLSGGYQATDKDMENIAGGGRETRLTDADAIIVDWLIKNEKLTKEEALKRLEPRRSGSSSGAGTDRKLDKGEMDDIANSVGGRIIAAVWSPERTDVPFEWGQWRDSESGEALPEDEMWELTKGIVDRLVMSKTLPIDMLDRIQGFETEADVALADLQREYPDTPMFDEDAEGRMAFNRKVSAEDRVKARRHASIKTYFSSSQGQAFKAWLTESANTGAYKMFFQPPPPAKVKSGQLLPTTTTEPPSEPVDVTRKRAPAPKPVVGVESPGSESMRKKAPAPQPEGWRKGMGKANPVDEISEGSPIENTITERVGIGRKDWVQRQGTVYRVLGFWATDGQKFPFMVKMTRYNKQYLGGKHIGYKKDVVWLYHDQLDDLQKINMPRRHKSHDRKQPDAVRDK